MCTYIYIYLYTQHKLRASAYPSRTDEGTITTCVILFLDTSTFTLKCLMFRGQLCNNDFNRRF